MNLKNSIAVGVLVMCAASAFTMPRNSYLVRPAKSMGSLISQIKDEPVVMDRYMRHFSMDEAEVVDYLGSLRLSRLDKSGIYLIYGVPRNGQLHATQQNLKKGTLVWVDEAGNAVLQEVCGNPMVVGPKRATMSDVLNPSAVMKPQGVVAMSTYPTSPITSAPAPVAMIPPTPTTPVSTVDPAVESPAVSRNGFGALLVPAALALASIDRRDSAVPEPATMIALATGVAALASRRKKN